MRTKNLIVTTTSEFEIGRIGKKQAEKSRPLNIAFRSENDKKAIFKKLRMLKDKDEFKGIAVAEDFTEAERKIIKMWSDKAKTKNKEETNGVIWRVCGSPKSGSMRLKKFERAPESHQ